MLLCHKFTLNKFAIKESIPLIENQLHINIHKTLWYKLFFIQFKGPLNKG